ncbi:hypothetical protein [Cupriavidus pauculus]|uniref:Uncharacterized protein n=1 Tax=Cupriavidus pauculus TaxID=82633 RepID=A0A2N5C346_9BURK|nr:hypothetical protein [Cupriavidus pauculus]PLP96646.1 hypothetical protein CYJ10_31020 [Cupriavidus pauculus]
MNDFGNGVNAVGQFDLLARFWRKPEMPEGLLLYAGALTCPVAASDLANLPQDCSPATVSFESMELGAHPIIVITLSVGALEIRWLADAKCSDIWDFIYMWRHNKVLPIVLGIEQCSEWVYRFYFPEMPDIARTPGELAETRKVWGDTEPWGCMVEYAKNHPATYPLLSSRVPPLPRPDDFKGLKVVLSPAGL